MRARFRGRCSDCGGAIHEGDEIVSILGDWSHEDCDGFASPTRNDLCNNCNLYHAGPCV